MSHARTPGSDIANGSLASSPPRRRLAPGDLEDDGNIGRVDGARHRGRSLLPVPPQRSPNDRRLMFFRIAYRRDARSNQPATESEADPIKCRRKLIFSVQIWPFSIRMPQPKGLKLFEPNSHAKTAPDRDTSSVPSPERRFRPPARSRCSFANAGGLAFQAPLLRPGSIGRSSCGRPRLRGRGA
jgi:hypothetical protein